MYRYFKRRRKREGAQIHCQALLVYLNIRVPVTTILYCFIFKLSCGVDVMKPLLSVVQAFDLVLNREYTDHFLCIQVLRC
jgi:hypothetical protein